MVLRWERIARRGGGAGALLGIAAALLAALVPRPAAAVGSSEVKAVFARPGRAYSTAPLWVWNDRLTEEQVVGTLRDLAGQQVKQVFVHPRPGLMTPYLSEAWFRLWKAALREAERLDMNVWIYDENSYPSGFAGGFVPEAMPASRGRGLVLREVERPPAPGGDAIGIFRLTEAGYEDVTAKRRAGEALPAGRYLVASIRRAGRSPWFGGWWYVDLLYPGVTEKFLEITLGAYRREVGEAFGRRIPGVFTDEPQLRPAGGLPWTDDLPRAFARRWGYPLTDHLPGLVRPLGDWRRVRHDYYQLLLELFVARWAKPCHDACARYGLQFTGHYWEHEWPNTIGVPDNMAMYAWHQRPAIDCLMNQYREDTHAQFGNARAVRELASVANQLGRRRTLCEAYGAGGWDLRFQDMKRIGDWLYVLGVNTLDEHLSYITIRGARKRDHPQSFSYHEPWWEAYHVMATYFTRLSAALSHGEQVHEILLLEPTTTAWLYQADPTGAARLEAIGDRFQALVTALEAAQVEYDIGCEDLIARHGSVEGGAFRIGRRAYRTVVLPPLTENLNDPTARLLEAFLAGGGTVLCCGDPPVLVDGRPSDRARDAAGRFRRVEAGAVPGLLLGAARDGFAIRRRGEGGKLFHHRRRLDDGELLFLVNTSLEEPCAGTVASRSRGAEIWDPATGRIDPCPFRSGGGGIQVPFDLPPTGSLLVFLSRDPRDPAPPAAGPETVIEPSEGPRIRRIGPNVLTIDYVDVTAGGESKRGIYFYAASRFAFQKNGMDRNPWDSAVQFRDELIRKTFPPGSGFQATYRFTIEGRVPRDLAIVIERPDLYRIACNGTPVSAAEGAWWLDRSFGRIPIASAARVGENAVTIGASPFTIYHELEPAYVLGSFATRAAASGFAIVPDRPLELGPWREQGHPMYAKGVAYAERFDIPRGDGRFRVRLRAWYGSVAKVVVNGAPAGSIAYPPWECDVTPRIRTGANEIEVIIIGTLKNTLGPHHGNPPLGSAWPGMFRKAPRTGPPPGDRYHTVGYGLFAPFVLVREGR